MVYLPLDFNTDRLSDAILLILVPLECHMAMHLELLGGKMNELSMELTVSFIC